MNSVSPRKGLNWISSDDLPDEDCWILALYKHDDGDHFYEAIYFEAAEPPITWWEGCRMVCYSALE